MFVTHSGAFHEDEIFALALLRKFLFNGQACQIVRTRDQSVINDYMGYEKAFVVDVGGILDPSKKCFDHHQAGCEEAWEDGSPKSSCGLIWTYLVQEGLVNLPPEVVDRIQKEFIIPVDKEDNGIDHFPEIDFVSSYNRDAGSNLQDGQFDKAAKAAFDYLDNLIYHIKKSFDDEKAVRNFIKNNGESEIVVFKKKLSAVEIHLAKYEKPKIFCFPFGNDANKWGIQMVPLTPDNPFSQRVSAPEEWRGLIDDDLKDISGFSELVFCHKSGFFIVANNADENSVKEIAEVILQYSLN